ncbi:MAG TPA: transcription termination factor NusA [Candidatus Binatia bacterium]|jgi:N utilization substance protein A|nr:transcription termination factor NusA [Candidatus Binatia bacterium]
MSSPILQAIKQISDEKNISAESVIETIEAALAAAYRKDFGQKNQNAKVVFDAETGDFEVFDVKTVVEDQELPPEELEAPEEEERPGRRMDRMEPATPPAPPLLDEAGNPIIEKKFNPKTEIMVTAARETLKKDAELGDEIRTKLEVPAAFGRMAAQTAKQVIIQKLREAERNKLFGEFKERERELINATVQRREGRAVLIDLGRTTAVMPPEEQIMTERYMPGDRIKVFVTDVRMTTRGPEVVVSRAHPEIVRKLFTLEIPEVAGGVVKIHAIAREAGSRSKVAVSSTQENVDPIGSCIGQRGTRIQTVIGELGGEKIDIIQFDEDPKKFIMNSLSPAKVTSIELREEMRTAEVIVPEDQLSLAIGKGGQNVRLASRLTGWKINIRESGARGKAEEAEGTPETPEESAVAQAEAAEEKGAADETAEPAAE